MKSIELFNKNGYKQRYNDKHCVIYDLEKENNKGVLPSSILIEKPSKEIQLVTDDIEKYTNLGTFTFVLNKELLEAINSTIKEIEENRKKIS